MGHQYDLIVRGGQVVGPDGVRTADIGVCAGKIVAVEPEIPGSGAETADAAGLHVFPACVDAHVHFDDPGRTEWETIRSGSSALAAGGAASYLDMPLNCSPCTLNAAAFRAKAAVAAQDSFVDYAFWGGLTPQNLDKLEELAECGVAGYKAFACFSGIDEFGRADDYTMLRGMEKIAKLGLPLMVHCENAEITQALTEQAKAENRVSAREYGATRPPLTEIESVARTLALAEETGCRLIIAHVSTAEAIDLVTAAREKGVDVYCETIGHYLIFTEEDVVRLGAAAKCSPPIRDEANRAKMWARLLTGEIAFVSSDHSPSDPKLKEGDFLRAWGGIAGCQSTLPALLTHAWHERRVGLRAIAALTASNAADIFALPGKGRIAPGFDADLALVDLDRAYTLAPGDLFYKHQVSPYAGRRFRGAVTRTWLRGRTVFRDGRMVGEPAGRLLRPVV
ncbi:MAG: allantoinase AllB [Gracilibacteraceae bacterium]|jgi:allantoinase|nr:allantoinase AllB [Gracilibacteraceae bacterium]